MARSKKKLEPTKRGVPAYMTSFADMMTLMLTFFILLVAFAEEQRAELVAAGTGSFIRALNSFGLPGLLPGGRHPIELDHVKPNFLIHPRHIEPDPAQRPLSRDLPRQPEDRLTRSRIQYHLRNKRAVALATSVTFRPGSAALDEASRAQLGDIAALAQQNLSFLGIEAHTTGPDNGWALSAGRAAAVARYLHAHGGIAYGRIALAGHGSHRPVAENRDGDPRNERVTIRLSPEPLD